MIRELLRLERCLDVEGAAHRYEDLVLVIDDEERRPIGIARTTPGHPADRDWVKVTTTFEELEAIYLAAKQAQ